MRDALSLLDQCSLSDDKVTEETVRMLLGLVGREGIRPLAQALGEADVPGVLRTMRQLMAQGRDVKQVLDELAAYLRAVLFQLTVPDFAEIELTDDREKLAEIGRHFTPERLMGITKRLHDLVGQLRWSQQPRALAELGLIECCYPETAADAGLQERVAVLEKRVEQLTAQLAGAAVMPLPSMTSVAPVQERPTVTSSEMKSQPLPNKPQVAQTPKTEPAAHAAPQHGTANVATGEQGKVWEQLLKEIEKSRKRSLLACISQGQLLSLQNGQARVSFESAFPKERTEKEDYRQVVENILQTIIGQPVQLVCQLGGAAAPAAQAGEAAQKAKAFFGGKLSPMK